MIQLYPHQNDVINKLRISLRNNDSVLVQAPTGFGKTIIAAFIAQSALSKQKTCWFLCHRKELVIQTSKTFSKFNIDHSYIASGFDFNTNASCFIVSVQTLKNRMKDLPQPDLVIWDECHHVAAKTWLDIKNTLNQSKHVGLSATPIRLDGEGLKQCFDDLVLGPDIKWLITNKYLSDYYYYATAELDLSGVKSIAGDYQKNQLSSVMEKSHLVGDIVQHWLKHAAGLTTLVFASSVNHSKKICEQFISNNIQAEHIDAKTDKNERIKLSNDFCSGKFKVLSNVDLMSEGVDLAALSGQQVTIECVILARPTQSLALYLQQVGRALRYKENHAIILDHAGNCHRHGLPDDPREWSLHSQRKRKKKTEQAQTLIRQCKQCFYVHKPKPQCPKCGHVYEIQHKVIDVVQGELQEIDKTAFKEQRKKEQSQANTLELLIQLGRQRNYKNPEKWAAHVYSARKQRPKKYFARSF